MIVIKKTLRIKAPIQKVWDTLTSVASVASCMPGVEAVEAINANTYRGKLKTKVAYISVIFDTTITVTRKKEPEYMETVAEGKAFGGMGRISQRQSIQLRAISTNETEGLYEGKLTVVGRLATLGQRAIPQKVEAMAEAFASAFKAKCEAEGATGA